MSHYFDFEKNWAGCAPWSKWLDEYKFVPYVMAVLYLGSFYFFRNIYTSWKPIDPGFILPLWNLGLAVFSIFGAYRTVPFLLSVYETRGFMGTVCSRAELTWCESPAGFWVFLFILSKLPELIDTAFLVMKKKNVILLHWYHHFTVMLFCWHAGADRINLGLWFAAMNLCVHSVMYTYYFLTALHINVIPGAPITILQILQMIVGVFLVSVQGYHLFIVGKCDGSNETNSIFAMLMYFSYLCLFVNFFFTREPRSSGDKKKKTSKEE